MVRRRLGKKACKRCKAIVDIKTNVCPICGSKEFSEEFSGIVAVLSLESKIAKKLGIKKEGIYALKVI